MKEKTALIIKLVIINVSLISAVIIGIFVLLFIKRAKTPIPSPFTMLIAERPISRRDDEEKRLYAELLVRLIGENTERTQKGRLSFENRSIEIAKNNPLFIEEGLKAQGKVRELYERASIQREKDRIIALKENRSKFDKDTYNNACTFISTVVKQYEERIQAEHNRILALKENRISFEDTQYSSVVAYIGTRANNAKVPGLPILEGELIQPTIIIAISPSTPTGEVIINHYALSPDVAKAEVIIERTPNAPTTITANVSVIKHDAYTGIKHQFIIVKENTIVWTEHEKVIDFFVR